MCDTHLNIGFTTLLVQQLGYRYKIWYTDTYSPGLQYAQSVTKTLDTCCWPFLVSGSGAGLTLLQTDQGTDALVFVDKHQELARGTCRGHQVL